VIRRSNTPSYLTQAEIRALFAAIANPRDHLLFGLAYAYGLRVGEIVLLNRYDVDLERRRIRIRRLKGGLSGERPIFRSLLPLLRQYLESRGDSTKALFVGRQGRLKTRGSRRSSATTRARPRYQSPPAIFASFAIPPLSTSSTRARE
jgi:integrase